MSNVLTQAELAHAKKLLDSDQFDAMYDYLGTKGCNNAGLAKAILKEGTPAGMAALEFMKNIAVGQGRFFTQESLGNIRRDMAVSYFDSLRNQQSNVGGIRMTRDAVLAVKPLRAAGI